MKDSSDPEVEAYLDDAHTWAADRSVEIERSQRRAWLVAAIAATVAALEAVALVGLTPLKTVQPYTLLVDRQTGYVEALKPLDPKMVADDTALTQSFLVQYVIAREGFDYDAVGSDYRKVGLWSTGEARQSYVAAMQASNPDSPLFRYRRSTTIDVTVKSVTSLSPRVAMVRFVTERRDAGGSATEPRNWVAVLRYGYSSAPLDVADRLTNPLGFQVSRYRRNFEVLPTAEAVTLPAAVRPDVVSSSPPAAGNIPQPSPVIDRVQR